MALPKRRHSSSRRDKRRNSYKMDDVLFRTCKATGVMHEPHRAYWVDDELYYRGKVVMKRGE